jgi:hypothetical protein
LQVFEAGAWNLFQNLNGASFVDLFVTFFAEKAYFSRNFPVLNLAPPSGNSVEKINLKDWHYSA